jgi:hypothetical protein
MQIPSSRPYKKVVLGMMGIVGFCLILLSPFMIDTRSFAQVRTDALSGGGIPLASNSQGQALAPTSPHVTIRTFAGNWQVHGGRLTIHPDGRASLVARAYVWCSPGVRQPCDEMRGNVIVDGVRKSIVLTHVIGNSAHGKITSSTTGDVGKSITITPGPHDTIMTSFDGMFCGPSSPPGYCGA